MKKVTRKALIQMGNVLYFPYTERTLPFSPFHIKYGIGQYNDWVCEEFPIAGTDSDVSQVYGDCFGHEDYVQKLLIGVEVPVSDLETRREGTYDNDDHLYIVYSKDDVRTMIKKLEALLEE